MNIYGYVSDNPINGRDDWGLKKYCCKINTTRQTTTYIPPGMGILPPGYYNDTRTTCSQNTINAGGSKDPLVACKCKYKNQLNISVYDAHEGECKSCTVTLKTFGHMWIKVSCEKESFIAHVFPNGDKDLVVEPPEENAYYGLGATLAWFTTSEKVAMSLKDLDYQNWDYSIIPNPFGKGDGNCVQFAVPMFGTLMTMCP